MVGMRGEHDSSVGLGLRDFMRNTPEGSGWGRARLEARRRRRAIGFYRGFVQTGALCFDIGANIGGRTELFRAIGARTIAVEPQSACVWELHKRFGDDPGVTSHRSQSDTSRHRGDRGLRRRSDATHRRLG